MKNRYVGIFGLMGSGKSVVINEFMYQNKEIKFLDFDAPPVQAQFRGMSFSFIDDIFAIEKNKIKINFFELDAPTINQWKEFIQVCEGLILVYNFEKDEYFEDHLVFINNILEYSKKDVVIGIIINNCNNLNEGISKMNIFFNNPMFENRLYKIINLETAETQYIDKLGKRVYIDTTMLKNLFYGIIDEILDK